MTSALCRGRLRKNRVFLALSGYFTKQDNSEEIEDLSTSPPGPEEPVSVPEISALPGSSAPSSPSTAFSLVLKYSEDDLQRIFKVVLEA